MAIKRSIWCDECGETFISQKEADQHEKQNCVPFKKDDRIEFNYRLFAHSGKVTRLGPKVGPNETRIVYVEADEQVEDADWSQCHSGKDFFVSLPDVRKLPEKTVP